MPSIQSYMKLYLKTFFKAIEIRVNNHRYNITINHGRMIRREKRKPHSYITTNSPACVQDSIMAMYKHPMPTLSRLKTKVVGCG